MRLTGYIKVAVVLAAVALSSCIDSRVPAPDIEGTIVAFEIEGQARPAVINTALRTVTIELGEAVDIKKAKVTKITLCESGSCGVAVGDVLDLTEPQKITVTTLADYEWTVSATQTIQRRFAIEGQVGASHFEMHSFSVFAHVPVGADMTQVKILSLKLWPEGLDVTLDPVIGEGDTVPFREKDGMRVRDIIVKYRDVTETWHLYVAETDIQLEAVDPFARRAYLSAYGQEDFENGFEYRLASDSEWTRVPDEMMTGSAKGIFTATLTGLEPETEYAVRAFSGETASEEELFTTGGERALPGGSFDQWHEGMDDRSGIKTKAQNPWPEGGVWEVSRWWDTGNKGVAVVDTKSGGNSLPTDAGTGSPANPSGRAAKLQTRWALVKAAGGNIYFGEFGEMDGLDATCKLGHNWQHKPTGLKGWFKYFPQPVDQVSEKHAALHPYQYSKEKWMGSMDSLHVCVALWASPDGKNAPFVVNTDTKESGKNFVDFSRDKPGVIAYGAFVSAAPQSEWAEFDIDIDYLKTGALPANTQLYLLVTASKNCNYFIAGTGKDSGTGSLMYVDELELVYD